MLSEQQKVDCGFEEGEEIVMPMPIYDSSSEDGDDDEHGQVDAPPPQPTAVPTAKFIPPSEEHVRRVLYGAEAHTHANRKMHGAVELERDLRRCDTGPFAVAAENAVRRQAYSSLTDDSFEDIQDKPLVLCGVPEAEGWSARDAWRTVRAAGLPGAPTRCAG